MKKIIIIFCLIILTGCTKGEKITCTIDGKPAEFTLKDGIINKYKIDGVEQKKSIVDEINGTYFTSSENNYEGTITLYNYVESLGGTCE